MIIIGIDPGSINTGYGIIAKTGNKLEHITSGVISVKGGEINNRLPIIFTRLQQIIAQYQPQQMVIEQVFIADNPQTAIKLGMARGVAILAGSLANLPVFELSARQAKKFVTGMGAAKKEQVNRMVCKILQLENPPKIDASDALALAISHAQTIKTRIAIASKSAQLLDQRSVRRIQENNENRHTLEHISNLNVDSLQQESSLILSANLSNPTSLPNSSNFSNLDLNNQHNLTSNLTTSLTSNLTSNLSELTASTVSNQSTLDQSVLDQTTLEQTNLDLAKLPLADQTNSELTKLNSVADNSTNLSLGLVQQSTVNQSLTSIISSLEDNLATKQCYSSNHINYQINQTNQTHLTISADDITQNYSNSNDQNQLVNDRSSIHNSSSHKLDNNTSSTLPQSQDLGATLSKLRALAKTSVTQLNNNQVRNNSANRNQTNSNLVIKSKQATSGNGNNISARSLQTKASIALLKSQLPKPNSLTNSNPKTNKRLSRNNNTSVSNSNTTRANQDKNKSVESVLSLSSSVQELQAKLQQLDTTTNSQINLQANSKINLNFNSNPNDVKSNIANFNQQAYLQTLHQQAQDTSVSLNHNTNTNTIITMNTDTKLVVDKVTNNLSTTTIKQTNSQIKDHTNIPNKLDDSLLVNFKINSKRYGIKMGKANSRTSLEDKIKQLKKEKV